MLIEFLNEMLGDPFVVVGGGGMLVMMTFVLVVDWWQSRRGIQGRFFNAKRTEN